MGPGERSDTRAATQPDTHRGRPPAATGGGENQSENRSYEVTLTAIGEFEAALARLDIDARDQPEWVRTLMRDAMESQLEDLRAELTELAAGHARPA